MPIQNQGNKTTVRNLLILIILILASGWPGSGLDQVMGNRGTDWLVSPMNGLLMAFFFIILGVGLRQLRKRKMLLASKGNIRIISEAA
jgi:hypothetical protein